MTTPTATPKPSSTSHRWITIGLGRICADCNLVQPDGEFDDAMPCRRSRTTAPSTG